MRHIGFTHEQTKAALNVVAAILHLGNISIRRDPQNQVDTAIIANMAQVSLGFRFWFIFVR